MLIYEINNSEYDTSIKWPANLYYGSRKYYIMNKKMIW